MTYDQVIYEKWFDVLYAVAYIFIKTTSWLTLETLFDMNTTNTFFCIDRFVFSFSIWYCSIVNIIDMQLNFALFSTPVLIYSNSSITTTYHSKNTLLQEMCSVRKKKKKFSSCHTGKSHTCSVLTLHNST